MGDAKPYEMADFEGFDGSETRRGIATVLERDTLRAERDALAEKLEQMTAKHGQAVDHAVVCEAALKVEQEAHRATKADLDDALKCGNANLDMLLADKEAAEARASRLAAALEKASHFVPQHELGGNSVWPHPVRQMVDAALADSAAEAPKPEKAHHHEKRGGYCPACEAKR